MPELAKTLPPQQLAEFLAVVSGLPDAADAVQVAVERAAEALEAEVAVALWPDSVTAVGYPAGRVPVAQLRAAVAARDQELDVPGIGPAFLVVATLPGTEPGHLLLARAGDPFAVEETSLVQAMARVAGLTLAMLRTIDAERALRERSQAQARENELLLRTVQDRQRLVDALLVIERAISRRDALQSILDTITEQARTLLRDEVAVLRLVDPDNPADLLLAASTGLDEQAARRLWRVPLAQAWISEQVITGGFTAVVRTAQDSPDGLRELPGGLYTAMAAQVQQSGTVVGSLVVASGHAERSYGDADARTLTAFAEHVSLALTDAKTVKDMREAFHDSLTGLASRALFLDRLEHQLTAGGRTGTPVGLLFIDLDRFKVVNDTLGHAAGDQLLVEVAGRIGRTLKAGDTAARFGGDEFAVLLENVDTEDAQGVADRIMAAIQRPFVLEGLQVFVNASIGIAIGKPGTHEAGELLRNADVAMYRAKRGGRGRRETFEPQMHEELMFRMRMEGDLRLAVEHGEFELRYQPIVSLADGQLSGFEAIVVWRRPGHGVLPPAQFMPLAEESGLALPIGRWALRAACEQGRIWQREYRRAPLRIGVNLSARQLQQGDVVTEVAEALAASGLHPNLLVLEINETVLHFDVDAAAATLGALKRLGPRLAVDDFGTGYSSLSCLHQFPVDIVKIDRAFVGAITEGGRAATFAEAIVKLGHMLHLETVAMGIEDAAQVNLLRRAGCHLGQGAHLGEPLTPDAAGALLHRVPASAA